VRTRNVKLCGRIEEGGMERMEEWRDGRWRDGRWRDFF
jgi:hypothetical protein